MMFALFFISFLLTFKESSLETIGLYSTDDDVVILTDKNFYHAVLGTDNAWIVEFYNSWCGHCIHFAPTWKKVGTDVKGWQRVISVAAIDCASSENLKICRGYNIGGYPTFRIFPPYADKNNTGEHFHEQGEALIRNKLVDYVSNKTVRQRAKYWPDLDILSSVEKIWEVAQDDHKHVALIFEHEGSKIGQQVILDVSNYKHLLVRRVSSKHVAKYGIKDFPSLYVVHRDGRFQRIAKHINDRGGFTNALLEFIGVLKVIDEGPDSNNVGEMKLNATIRVEKPHNNTSLQISNYQGLYIQDLESALSYSFRQEIAIKKIIDRNALEALKNFIKVLAKYFPGKEETKTFLWRVSTWLEHLMSDISGIQWAEKVDSFESENSYLPDTISWKSCAGSQPKYRGYPCGMWMLFHSLTVSAYISSKHNKKAEPCEVLLAINGYMKHFFGCQECSKNFGKMAQTVETEITSHRDSILWLWRSHNRANKRLHGDPSEDPKHIKIQFPSKKMCPECYFDDSDQNDLKWNSRQVFKFLLNFYQKSNILNAPQDRVFEKDTTKELDWWELKQRKNDLQKIHQIRLEKRRNMQAKNQPVKNTEVRKTKIYLKKSISVSGWGFSNIDFGMCVIFYVVCITLIVVLYYHFIVRRRYKPPCKFLPL